jgi:hypothetical protein
MLLRIPKLKFKNLFMQLANNFKKFKNNILKMLHSIKIFPNKSHNALKM